MKLLFNTRNSFENGFFKRTSFRRLISTLNSFRTCLIIVFLLYSTRKALESLKRLSFFYKYPSETGLVIKLGTQLTLNSCIGILLFSVISFTLELPYIIIEIGTLPILIEKLLIQFQSLIKRSAMVLLYRLITNQPLRNYNK